MTRLREKDVMAAEVLKERGMSMRAVARQLGCDESTLRYRLGRLREGVEDGRRRQPEACAGWAEDIATWIQEQEMEDRPAPVVALYRALVMGGYTGSRR